MQVYSVRGRVLVNGKPAVGANVSFFGIDDVLMQPEAPFPRGVVQADGTFELTSYSPGDGAPAGHFTVGIVWPMSDADDPELRDNAPDRLRGRYASPETSHVQVEVKATDNVLADINLK